jgi:hypothetical protein
VTQVPGGRPLAHSRHMATNKAQHMGNTKQDASMRCHTPQDIPLQGHLGETAGHRIMVGVSGQISMGQISISASRD